MEELGAEAKKNKKFELPKVPELDVKLFRPQKKKAPEIDYLELLEKKGVSLAYCRIFL